MQNYILHPSNMRSQDILLEMRVEEGSRGYGIYMMILELMRDANNYRIRDNAKYIAFAINEPDADCVSRIMHDYSLFTADEDGYIYSNWLRESLEELDKKTKALSEAGKRGARARKTNIQEEDNSNKTIPNQAETTLKPPLSHPQATLKPPSSINNINKEYKLTNQSFNEVIVSDSGEMFSIKDLDLLVRGKNHQLQYRFTVDMVPNDGIERNPHLVEILKERYAIEPYEVSFFLLMTDFGRCGAPNLVKMLSIIKKMDESKFKPKFWGNYMLSKMLEK